MALNLSRNTKVFVSSVNGCNPADGVKGGIKNGKITAGGTGYAVGDIITCDTTSGTGEDAKFIVKAVSSGVVTKVAMPNNCKGKKFIVGETAGQATNAVVTGADHSVTSSGEGFIFTVQAVTFGTTADGKRIGTGLFKGNEVDANTFRLGVLDGYSFSQGSDSTDVTISEAGATPNRGSKRFNDSLPPAEWSFGTYVRPFVHGAASYRANTTFDCVENIMWAALSGTGLPNTTENTAGAGVFVSTTAEKGSLCNFTESDVHELMKLSIYFALENTTYRLNQAQINQAEIDFSIDGIAQITWSGNATTIDQVSEVSEDPSVAVEFTTSDQGADSAAILSAITLNANSKALTDKGENCEEFNYVDTTGPSDADYLRNKLSSLHLSTLLQGGGKASQGLDAKEYEINITGGSLTIANNVTYVTPETIGIVDKPIGSFTGARVVSGSLTMYLDTKTNGSNDLLTDLAASTDLVSNAFDMRLFMGVSGSVTLVSGVGEPMEADDFTAPGVEFNMPRAHLTVPTIEVGDLISASVEFSANGSTLLDGDEMEVKYLGATTHSQAGYKSTGSQAEAVLA
jgi:hypothetical protein